ncbi:MAG: hypothetical protein KF822_11785 [Steroidobacteraceae bacterium]|nr:hypothetical protein [Steroidobacteraceae bacterium]
MIVIWLVIALLLSVIFQVGSKNPLRGAAYGFVASFAAITVFAWNSGHWDGQSKWYVLFGAVSAGSSAFVYAVTAFRKRGKQPDGQSQRE